MIVVDYQDYEVREFDGQGLSAYAAWDGTDQSGNPLSYGYYDYIVEARPSRYGPLSRASALSSRAMISTPPSGYELRAMPYKQTPAAMQFGASNTIPETIFIPSLNPTNQAGGTNDGGPPLPSIALSQAGYPTSAKEALEQGLTSYFVPPPPMPPILTNINGVRQVIPWEDVYGPQPPIEMQVPQSQQEGFLRAVAGLTPMDDPQPLDDWPDQTYSTRTPTRVPGILFFGFAGTVGIGYQGHHPSKSQVGAFASAPGGVTGFHSSLGTAEDRRFPCQEFLGQHGLRGLAYEFPARGRQSQLPGPQPDRRPGHGDEHLCHEV